jgi:hypothetical protein
MQSGIIEKRLKKRKRIEKICNTKKEFKPRSKVSSVKLIKYAKDDTYLELANTSLALKFIQLCKFKEFKTFIKFSINKQEENEVIEPILQRKPLEYYLQCKQAEKFAMESFRTKAMTLVNSYEKYQLSVALLSETLPLQSGKITNIKLHSFHCIGNEFFVNYESIKDVKNQFSFYTKITKGQTFMDRTYVIFSHQTILICDILIKRVKITELLSKILDFL